MTKMINARRVEKDLPFATDEECLEMRNRLVALGRIMPADARRAPEENERDHNKAHTLGVSRKQLVSDGLLHPIEKLSNGLFTFCETIPNPVPYRGGEEGEYSCRSIGSHDEYMRRKQAYFRMLQEILHSRRELRLVLGQKKNTDPDWYF